MGFNLFGLLYINTQGGVFNGYLTHCYSDMLD